MRLLKSDAFFNYIEDLNETWFEFDDWTCVSIGLTNFGFYN